MILSERVPDFKPKALFTAAAETWWVRGRDACAQIGRMIAELKTPKEQPHE